MFDHILVLIFLTLSILSCQKNSFQGPHLNNPTIIDSSNENKEQTSSSSSSSSSSSYVSQVKLPIFKFHHSPSIKESYSWNKDVKYWNHLELENTYKFDHEDLKKAFSLHRLEIGSLQSISYLDFEISRPLSSKEMYLNLFWPSNDLHETIKAYQIDVSTWRIYLNHKQKCLEHCTLLITNLFDLKEEFNLKESIKWAKKVLIVDDFLSRIELIDQNTFFKESKEISKDGFLEMIFQKKGTDPLLLEYINAPKDRSHQLCAWIVNQDPRFIFDASDEAVEKQISLLHYRCL